VRWRFSRALARLAGLAAIGSLVAVVLFAVMASPAQAPRVKQSLFRSSGDLDVVPFPGTPDVPPGTRIDFPALAPAQLVSVRVVGSRSGSHTGTLTAQPGGRGTQFVPDRPFVSGERVAVGAALRSKAAAAAVGVPRARGVRFSFQVTTPAPANLDPFAYPGCGRSTRCKPIGYRGRPPSARRATARLTHTFQSAPRLHPPVVTMVGKDADTAAGDIFLDARHSGYNGPYILGPDGRLLWFDQLVGGEIAGNVRVQHYAHHPVLTYFLGRPGGGVGVLLNEHYQPIHTVTAGDGYQGQWMTLHEFQLTPEGTALFEVHANVRADLTSIGGPRNGVVADSIIQEVNIATNRVVWEWSALGHLPLRDSYAPYQRGVPYDAFHFNSIQQIPGGNLLVSSRHMSAVFSINKDSGKVNWELGGKHPTFSMGPGTQLGWQHDAQLHGHGLLTVFDNGAGETTMNESQSRAVEIALHGRRASLLHAYTHVPPVLAWAEGSVQLLPGRNVFVGWGMVPAFSEYTPGGRQVFTAGFGSPVTSYRAYRDHWEGEPLWPPSIDVKPAPAGEIAVYASWNGATQVVRWRVLAGASKTAVRPVAEAPLGGFETRIAVHTRRPYVEVQALAAGGRVLATSRAVPSKGACAGPEC
jgi:hypothetical protein